LFLAGATSLPIQAQVDFRHRIIDDSGGQAQVGDINGDGRGHFQVQELPVGVGNHDSRVADVNGDDKLDSVTKRYTGNVPRLDV
jgi:hypothetical protein